MAPISAPLGTPVGTSDWAEAGEKSPGRSVSDGELPSLVVSAAGAWLLGRPVKKSQWGTRNGRWVPHDTGDEVVDYVRRWNKRTEIPAGRFVGWLGITPSKFHAWRRRYGKVNEHNAWIPRDWWLEDWEKQAIIRFSFEYPLEGYRRLAFMMLDRDVAAASPSSVYRVLKAAGRIGRSPSGGCLMDGGTQG